MMQTLLAALLVGGSATYVVWTLLPAAARRRIATALLRLRWPGFVVRHLQAQAKTASGCSCEGCGDRPATPGSPQPVHWAPRRKR